MIYIRNKVLDQPVTKLLYLCDLIFNIFFNSILNLFFNIKSWIIGIRNYALDLINLKKKKYNLYVFLKETMS